MFPNLPIDNLWKFLAVGGLFLFIPCTVYPLNADRDYQLKRVELSGEFSKLQTEIAIFDEAEKKSLNLLHRHGIQLMRLLYDENGKLREAKQTKDLKQIQELGEKIEQANVNSTAIEKERKSLAVRSTELDRKQDQVEVDRTYVNSIGRFCLYGKLIGGVMAFIGFSLWLKLQRLADSAGQSGENTAAARRPGIVMKAGIVVGLMVLAISLAVPEYLEQEIQFESISANTTRREWWQGVKKFVDEHSPEEEAIRKSRQWGQEVADREKLAADVERTMRNLVAKNPGEQHLLELTLTLSAKERRIRQLTATRSMLRSVLNYGVWFGLCLACGAFAASYLMLDSLFSKRNAETPPPAPSLVTTERLSTSLPVAGAAIPEAGNSATPSE